MNYQEVIESRYNRQKWQELLHDIFGNKVEFWKNPSEIATNSQLSKQTLWLGTITLSDGETIRVYEVELADSVVIERNRRGIRDMLLTDWRNSDAGAFMFCYRKNESILRFSYVSETWGFNKDGEYEKISTDTKRYTYLLGENHGCRTAIDQFKALKNSKQTLSDVTAAFSVEALTQQFYKDLFEWYLWAIDPASNITFPNNPNTEKDDRDDIESKVIRMITRIMFVWFIKQKNLVPDRLFDVEYLITILRDFNPYSSEDGNYYNAILQNLFFATLNTERTERGFIRPSYHGRSESFGVKNLYRDNKRQSWFTFPEGQREEKIKEIFDEVPYLNGGLFECLDKFELNEENRLTPISYHDGFSSKDTRLHGNLQYRAFVPNNLFFKPEKGLISILSRYNFTIEENSPEEQQVALDPELLGKVFENLLGAYNPETKETARNQSGSFYTPREIVNYMVDESLVAYLGDNAFVRSLFGKDFVYDNSKAEEYRRIAQKLKSVKVLDPACGSGAFPMGLLNRMIDILGRISPNDSIYDLKLSVIENCLFGSDIQNIAAQITKLRFFISLICDCEKDSTKPNFGIPTLPNLETKFVTANSLISLKRKHGNDQLDLFEDDDNNPVNIAKTELAKVRDEHFRAKRASEKRRLRTKDQQLREQLTNLLTQDDIFAPEDARQLAAWNPYDQNAVSPFFDPEWMFDVADGFDIVIGNPPYIQLQNNGGELAKLYENCNYSTFARTGDIYCLFFERGWQLLKQGGHLCYITSNKWMRAGYGEKTREFFAKKTNPMLLIDFAGVKIFESATVDTNILLFSKSSNQHKTTCAVTNKQNKDSIKNLSDFVQQQNSICDFATSDSWVILSPIEQSIKKKIEAVGTPLKDWDINIYRGVLTGCNEAFIIDSEKRDEILSNCQTEEERKRTAELIRPILRGRDIKRYGYDWANLYLIATFPSRHYDIDKYPAVKQYLLSFGIERLEQTGKLHIVNGEKVKARKKTNNKWFETQDSISYWEDFFKPKVMWKIIGCNINFCFDERQLICNNAVDIMVGDRNNLIQFVGLMNSKLFDWYLKLTTEAEVQGGGIQLYVTTLEKTLLKLDFQQAFTDIVYQRIENQVTDEAVDKAVFEAYRLTTEEQAFILQDRRVNRNRED